MMKMNRYQGTMLYYLFWRKLDTILKFAQAPQANIPGTRHDKQPDMPGLVEWLHNWADSIEGKNEDE